MRTFDECGCLAIARADDGRRWEAAGEEALLKRKLEGDATGVANAAVGAQDVALLAGGAGHKPVVVDDPDVITVKDDWRLDRKTGERS